MRLSIVTTLYYSAPYLQEFYDRARRAALSVTPDYEFVIVNDGSPDDVMRIAQGLVAQDERVVVIDLSRNFGHHKAIMTGLAHASGDLVFLIDCDLEEAPEALADFYAALQADPEADAVYGVQPQRQGSALRRVPGDLYYRLVRALSEHHVPQNILMTRLMTRRYVADLVRYRENLFSIEGLWALTGYRQIPLTLEKTYKGSSTYNWSRKLWLAIYGITAMSSKPLVLIAYLGLFIMIPSALLIGVLIAQRLSGYTDVDGWTSVLVSVWFLGGLIIFILGIMAIYISVIFTETKPRPYTVIRQILRHPQHAATPIYQVVATTPTEETR
jgi:putative glycosyltransferase